MVQSLKKFVSDILLRLNRMPSRRQVAGGSWDEYCYCCGLPYNFGFDLEDERLSDGTKLSAEQKSLISGKAASVEKASTWLTNSIGLDSYNKVIFELGPGGDIGDMFMKKVQTYPEAQAIYEEGAHIFSTGEIASTMNEDDDSPRGLAIHKDCAAVLESAIGRSLKPEDEKKLRELNRPGDESRNDGACFSKYNEQFYAWTDAVLNESASFFASPKTDAGQKARFLECNSKLIAALKAGGRRRRTNKRRASKARKTRRY